MSYSHDKGIIGEPKTREGKIIRYDNKTGLKHIFHTKGANSVTPVVEKDLAHFDVFPNYIFDFSCIGWRYKIAAVYQIFAPDDQYYIGWSVELESPGKKAIINIKKIDLIAGQNLCEPPTEEQLKMAMNQAVDEPNLPEEKRIFAARQALEWVLENDFKYDNLSVNKYSQDFSLEQIGKKKFVKAEVNLHDTKTILKRCNIWALNYWAYRYSKASDARRRIIVWICTVLTDPDDPKSAEILEQSRRILETLEFSQFNVTVYPELK